MWKQQMTVGHRCQQPATHARTHADHNTEGHNVGDLVSDDHMVHSRTPTNIKMDAGDLTSSSSLYVMALYALISFLLVMMTVMLLYVVCSKRFRLNWFEKNLLETAEMACSQEALVNMSEDYDPQLHQDDKFWVPPTLHRASVSISDVIVDPHDVTSGESAPATPLDSPSLMEPDSPLALPLARSDKHVVLSTTAPCRPRVSSMHTKLDHTKIDTTLYQKPSPTQTPSEPEDLRGSVQITLTYDPVAGILSVRLIEAHDLQARDFSGTADPYAKIRLLPDRSNVWQTRIHKRTLNPVFDEDFVFEVRPAAVGRRTLEILLYDFDAFSRHHSIGGIKLPLTNVDLTEKLTMWRALDPCSEQDAKAELGELLVSLGFLPSAERLTVVVVKARNLRVVDDTRTSSDPYVKVTLSQNGKRIKKRKTGVHRNTVAPVFNEALTFDVSREALSRCSVEFCVMHDSLLGPSETLGRAAVTQDTDRELFQQMLASKTATSQWLPLVDVP